MSHFCFQMSKKAYIQNLSHIPYNHVYVHHSEVNFHVMNLKYNYYIFLKYV